MQINVIADERSAADIPEILKVGKYITDTYGHDVATHFRPGMFSGAVEGGKLDPARFSAGGPTVALTGYDLKPAGLNFTFGITQGDAVLVSTARLKGDLWRFIVLTLHEVGHLSGLVDGNCRNHDDRHYFEGHCRNACVMQAINNLSDLDRVVAVVKSSTILCADCRGYLRR